MHDRSGGEIQRAFEVQPKAADIASREVVCGLSRLGALIRCSISWLVAEALKSLSNDSDVLQLLGRHPELLSSAQCSFGTLLMNLLIQQAAE